MIVKLIYVVLIHSVFAHSSMQTITADRNSQASKAFNLNVNFYQQETINLFAPSIKNYGDQNINLKKNFQSINSNSDDYDAFIKEVISKLSEVAHLQEELNKVEVINNYINQSIQYESDQKVWGKTDYWQTLGELFAIGKGDCEDYALAKYKLLTDIGIPKNRLWFRYVRMNNGKSSQAHMILVFQSPQGQHWVVDNYINTLIKLEDREVLAKNFYKSVSGQFKSIYEFNTNGIWLINGQAQSTQLTSDLTKLKRASHWFRRTYEPL